MPFGVVTSVTGNAGVKLRDLSRRIQETRPLVDAATLRASESMKRNIQQSRSPSGEPYAPLSEFTLANRKGDSMIPLKDTLMLFHTIHPETRSDAVGWAGPLGLDAYYYAYQNQGTSKRGNFRPGETVTPGIKARPFIGIRDEDLPGYQEDAIRFVRAVLLVTAGRFN